SFILLLLLYCLFILFSYYCHQLNLYSFPTRRSSDLINYIFNVKFEHNEVNDWLKLNTVKEPNEFNLVINYGLDYFAKDKKNLERSEEHTSELQSRFDLVCRLLLEKKNHT